LNVQTNRSKIPTIWNLIKSDSKNRHLQTDGHTGVAILIGEFLQHFVCETCGNSTQNVYSKRFVWFAAMLLLTSC
jgi:hypothetical protein